MLRRSILNVSSRQSLRRIPRQITTQIPAFLSSRKEFSSTTKQNASQGAGPKENPPKSGGNLSKIVIAGVTLGAGVITAYQTGYLDQIFGKQQHSSSESGNVEVDSKYAKDVQQLGDHAVLPNSKEPSRNQKVEHDEQKVGTHENFPHLQDSSVMNGEDQFQVKDKSDLVPQEDTVPVHEEDLPDHSHTIMTSDDQNLNSGISSEGNVDMKDTEAKSGVELNEEVSVTSVSIPPSMIPEETEMKSGPPEPSRTENIHQDALDKNLEAQCSLTDGYHLRAEADKITAATSTGKDTYDHEQFSEDKEATVGASEDINDAYIAKDGKLILDFLQAIHAAERRQSELDAHEFAKEKRTLKEKYEKELKDARVRELMYAEEAAILDEELNKERIKAAAAIKLLEEKAEEKLKMELEQKENEAELKLKEVQELAKAELAAAIASEKASQIEKMAEANLHINALCMAFYAQSEEARQSHSVHKLALGALALEDTLSKGLPIRTEIEALHTSLEGIDKDSLIDLVLSSLPEETRNNGTDTLSQLHQKFDALKGTLRHFSLIPPGGGGILTHSLAHVASWLKVKETSEAGDGIESVIKRVESYLAEGRLAEAAEALEEGVRGSQASEIIGDWVERARNRAITEQALAVLQSYATSISLT